MSNFDKHIKDKLSDAEMPVSGGLWEAIESQIVVQKEPSKFWFLFLLAAFTLPIFFLYELGENNKKQQAEADAAMHASIEAETATHQSSFDESLSLDKLVLESSSSDINSSDDIQTTQASTELSQFTNTKTTFAGLIEPANTRNINTGFSSANVTEETAQDHSSQLDLPAHKLASSASHLTMNSRAIDQILPLSHIIKPVREIDGRQDLSFSRYYTARDCPSFAGFNPGMYVFGEFDAGFSSTSLTAKQSGIDEYLAIRSATEKGGMSISSSIGLGYQFRNGLIAETGLSYDNIKLNFDPKGLTDLENTTVIVIKEIITGMDTIYSYDTLNHLDEVYANAGSNTFKQINIPLIIGHEFPLSSKMRLSLKGGIMINIVSMSKGQIVGNSEDYYPLYFGQGGEESNTELYKSNVGFGYTGGLNLEADLSDHITLYAGTNIRYYPNTFSLASNSINQKFHKFGVTTGIKYRL